MRAFGDGFDGWIHQRKVRKRGLDLPPPSGAFHQPAHQDAARLGPQHFDRLAETGSGAVQGVSSLDGRGGQIRDCRFR